MTSLIQVNNNCSWNIVLCHRPTKGTETRYVGISHGCALHDAFVLLPTRSISVTVLQGQNKDGSYPVISFAEVKETQLSHTSHPATRVREIGDDTTHLTGYLSLTTSRYILSGNCVCVSWKSVFMFLGLKENLKLAIYIFILLLFWDLQC